MKFKKGDKITVLSGKDKGRSGEIEKILNKKEMVLIPNINMCKKHIKKTDKNKGGIIEFARPLKASKVVLVCPECKKRTRLGFTFVDKEKKRVCKKCNKLI